MSKLQVNDIVDKDDVSAPGFSKGAVITGVCTATTFVGALTGNADTATTATSASGNAGGLTGSPSITVTDVNVGGAATVTGKVMCGDVGISSSGLSPSSYGSPNLLVSGTDSTLTLMGDGSTNNTSYTGIKFRVAGASTGDYTKVGIFAQRQATYNDLDLIFAMDTAADANSVAISDEKVRIKSSGRVGINTAEPFSELHIAASNVAKTWTTYDGTVLTVENYDSDGSIIQMVGRNTAPCGIWFGDEDSKNSGRIRYDHGTDMLSLWASGGAKRIGVGPTLSEKTKVTAGKLSDNTNIDLDYGNVHLFTTAESTTCTPNIRVDSSTTLNSVMEVGETTVVTLITTANASAYCEHITIDGSAVTENWIGGSAPSGGGSSGVDIHAFTIIKTAANTYTVLGNHSKTS